MAALLIRMLQTYVGTAAHALPLFYPVMAWKESFFFFQPAKKYQFHLKNKNKQKEEMHPFQCKCCFPLQENKNT